MSRFAPYFGIVAALIVGVLISVFFGGVAIVRAPAIIIPNASSTSSVTDSNSTAATSSQAIPTTTKTAPPKNSTSSSTLVAPVPPPTTVPTPVVLSTSEENALLDSSASLLRGALVNILCYVPAGSTLHSISGSGIFIDPKGIILTNSHIAQYFLLADRGASCTIRSGSPAIDSYKANLIYISPLWLNANAKVLTQDTPSGTGEYDFALLAVSQSATASPLPTVFPYISPATTPPIAGTPVAIASYGAQFLQSSQIASDLFPTIVFGSVKDVFTFATNTIDVLALGGSAAAQEGSSGGGIADASNKLVGTITTSTISGSTDTRSLGAITASYIRAEYANETGQALDSLLSESTASSISNFAPKIPSLESIITTQLH
jgi:hypothetical protein